MVCVELIQSSEGMNAAHAFIPVWFRGEEEESLRCSFNRSERKEWEEGNHNAKRIKQQRHDRKGKYAGIQRRSNTSGFFVYSFCGIENSLCYSNICSATMK